MTINKKISTKLPAGLELPTRIKPTPVPRVELETIVSAKPIAQNAATVPEPKVEATIPAPIVAPAIEPLVQEPRAEPSIKESYLSSKLRMQEAARKSNKTGGRPSTASVHGLNQQQMDQMWREMEDQISYTVLQGKELPQDFLDSIGLSGEQVMISPRAIAALKQMMEGKKHV